MGLGDLFRRRKAMDSDEAIGMGAEDGDLEPAEGGPSIFRQELAEYRWAAQQEAFNIARRGVDPERWDEGRMAFEFERALAHDHEALRDRLANYVGQRVRNEVRELYSLAGTVAEVRDELQTVDDKLVQVTKDWRAKHDEVAEDELELSRYYRNRSKISQAVKYAVAIVFVIGEFLISGRVFDVIFPELPQGMGYVLAFGVTLALIVIPHYAALGLKEGLTQYHVFEKRKLEKDQVEVPIDVERAVHVEEKDDLGFRRAAFLVGAGLAIMIVPLSWIRANEEGAFSWAAFFFLLFLQYVLSGYFFLREWLDHGHPSHSLNKLIEEKDIVEETRVGIMADLSLAVTDFHDEAEDLLFTLQQAPRWDSQIVETYGATIRYFRHLITVEQPECEQFITWARVPYLGSKSSAADSSYPLDPVSEEHRSLEEDGPLGREWWLRTTADALRTVQSDAEDDGQVGPTDEASWLIAKSPDGILAEFLRRYFDLPFTYKRPPGISAAPLEEDEPTVDQERSPERSPTAVPPPSPDEDVEQGLRKLLDQEGDGWPEDRPRTGP